MKVAILLMLIGITCGLWITWIYVMKKRMPLDQTIPVTIAMAIMTPCTVFYGTYYGACYGS